MYGEPEITKSHIKCEECGKWYKKIVPQHLKLHGLTIPEYKKKWGYCNTQPLECKDITDLRREYAKEFGLDHLLKWKKENPDIAEKNKYKKGEVSRGEGRRSEQERQAMIKRIINSVHTEITSMKKSEASKRKWQDSEYREKVIKGLKDRYKDPEIRKKVGEAVLKAYRENPEIKKAISEGNKKYWNSPEGKKKASQRSIKIWREIKNNKSL